MYVKKMFQVSIFVSWIALDWNAKELDIKLQFCIVSLHHQYNDLWRTTVNFYLHILVSTKSYDPGGTYSKSIMDPAEQRMKSAQS